MLKYLKTVKLDDVLERMLYNKRMIGKFFKKLELYLSCETVDDIRYRLEIDASIGTIADLIPVSIAKAIE